MLRPPLTKDNTMHTTDLITESQQEFKKAINEGRLSLNLALSNCAYNYMYMGKDKTGKALFKNRDNRQYDI